MPNTEQAKKRMKQDSARRQRNRARKTELKTFTKKVTGALEAGDMATAEDMLKLAQKKADKAAKGGAIHRNKAARRKSRLQKKLNAAKAAK